MLSAKAVGQGDNTPQDPHYSLQDTKAEFNYKFFYNSFKIIPSLKTRKNMLTSINVTFIFDSLGDKCCSAQQIFCK